MMQKFTVFGLGCLAGILMAATTAEAFCKGSGMETGAGFDCADGSLSVFAGSGAGQSYLKDDGNLGFVVGSGSSRTYGDGSGGGGSLLGQGAQALIVTDDGRWGTLTRHGNTNFMALDPTIDDEVFPGGFDAFLFEREWN